MFTPFKGTFKESFFFFCEIYIKRYAHLYHKVTIKITALIKKSR
jgi:hypothetical protein